VPHAGRSAVGGANASAAVIDHVLFSS
jgi:hypothetical protein